MRICVDPGHGGEDPGAVSSFNGAREKDVNLTYALDLAGALEIAGSHVILTRTRDVYIPLQQRCNIANRGVKHNAGRSDIFISVHANGSVNPAAYGWEVWTSPGPTNADILATMIYRQVESMFPEIHMRPDWSDGDPDREAKLYVLQNTWMPAVLVELGFMSNTADLINMQNHAWQRRMITGIVQGVNDYAGRG